MINAEQFLANTPVGVFSNTVSGHCLAVNPALATMLGYASPGELLADVTDVARQAYVDPRRRQELLELIQANGQITKFEAEFYRRDRSVIWVSISAHLVAEPGKPPRIEGTVVEITDRVHAEESLRKERSFLRTLINQSQDIIYATDYVGRIIFSNQAAARAWAETRRSPVSLGLPNGAAQVRWMEMEDHAVILSRKAVLNVEETAQTAQGVRMLLTSRVPLFDPKGNVSGVLVVKRDITEHKATLLQLQQAQKMEALGRVAGGVAHDFNNLLTVVLGCSMMALECAQLPGELRTVMTQIADAARSGGRLTAQLLAFSRGEPARPELVSLTEVVALQARLLREVIGPPIDFVTESIDGPAFIMADASQLEQIIMNLALNARDAMPDGGTLMIATREESRSDGRHCYCLRISDTGVGIAPEVLPRIFEPFFTTKARGHGNGLGLATLYRIIQENGWQIDVKTKLHCGTTFEVRIPVAAAPAPPATPSSDARGVASSFSGGESHQSRQLSPELAAKLT